MKLVIILENAPSSELERKTVDVQESDDQDEAANLAIHEALETWVLSPGDTIRIVAAE